MKPEKDLTVVVGLDGKTVEQWALTLPTWALNRSRLIDCRWVIFYDWTQLDTDRIVEIIGTNGLDRSQHIKFVPWPDAQNYSLYGTQRERMLTGFVFVPAQHVTTQWWLKLDTDVIAENEDHDWLPDSWFSDSNVMLVAPGWGYTKTKGDDRTATEWAEALEEFGDRAFDRIPRLGLADRVRGHNKIIYPRWWSPVSYYRTSWNKYAADLARRFHGPYRLPVPSQDTYLWYVSDRGRFYYLKQNHKKVGWNNYRTLEQLQVASARVLDHAKVTI